jgi:hypothetical protein
MRNRLNSLMLAGLAVALLGNGPISARADETNDAKQAKPERKVFFFEGGNPIDFILAMDKHFRTRLGQILSIPSSLTRAHVPKMKVSTDKPEDALQVYNHLQDPMLGQWRYTGPSGDPNVLALVADKDVAMSKSGARVKALSLRGLGDKDWPHLAEDVEMARRAGMKEAERLGGDKYEGSIQIQKESNILIAAGSDAFIEMVESIVSAHRDNSMLNHR